MSRRADVLVAQTVPAQWTGTGTIRPIRTPGGVLYLVYIATNNDVAFRKSLDDGISWSNPVYVHVGTAVGLSVWYDKWSGLAGGLIHCVYTDSGTDDTFYRTINTESSDALSTATTIFLGASTAAGGHISVTRAQGGNVYCKTLIDAGAEGGFYRLLDADVPNGAWAARTVNEALATLDQMILVPGFAADTNDIIGIFWDASANEISRQIYDDSADSWAETSIAGSMVELSTATAFANFDCAVDLTNSRLVLAAWTQADLANADLRCWTLDETTITEVTNVVLNSVDDQALCAVAVDPDDGWFVVFYVGNSAGTETWPSNVNVYVKISKDGGTTWGPETMVTSASFNYAIKWIACTMRPPDGRWGLAFFNDQTLDELLFVAPLVQPRATYQLGV